MKYKLMFTLGLWTVMAGVGWTQLVDFDLRRNIPWRIGDVGSSKTPTKIVAVWTDAVLHQAGKVPTRGFGGRLLFYGPDESTPIKVDGTLVVYAFDEEGRSPTDVKPDRKYVFPPDQFARHYSKSKLGHSYSVWIPWDEVGGPRKEITLIARFIPKNGSAIVSGQSRQILPGLPPAEELANASTQDSPTAPARQGGAGIRSEATPAWPRTARQTAVSSSPSTEARGTPEGVPSQRIPEAPNVAFPEEPIPSTSSPGRPAPGGNPLRTTSYETPPATQIQPQTPEQPSPATTRMKTTTIPVPAPLLRPSNPSGPTSAGGSGILGAASLGSTFRSTRPMAQAEETPPGNLPAASYGGVTSHGMSSSVGNRFGGGAFQKWGSAPDGISSASGGATDSAETPRPLSRWPQGRPAIRSGPLGPQAPTGAIGPQAHDRAALPPLP